MQGPTVAKLAMEASRRHYLHEPRRRPQSTFIVVRHSHFLGNRGFGVRNELCTHIDYGPLFSRVQTAQVRCRGLAQQLQASIGERAVGNRNRILAYPKGGWVTVGNECLRASVRLDCDIFLLGACDTKTGSQADSCYR
jgi:hypothetical protein